MKTISFVSRLRLSYGVIIALMVVLAVIGIQRVSVIDSTLQSISEEASLKQRYAINFRGSVHDRAISIRDAVLVTSDRELQRHLTEIDQLAEFYKKSAEPMRLQLAMPNAKQQERDLMQRINDIESRTLALSREVIETRTIGDINGARELLLNEVSGAYSEWLARINAFIDYQEVRINEQVTLVQGVASAFATLMIVLTLLAAVIGFIVAYRITLFVQSSLGADPVTLRDVALAMAQEDYSVSFPESIQTNSVMAVMKELVSNLSGAAGVAIENARIRKALDAASTNVMMADAEFNIIYMNPAVQNMMKLAEKDLQAELPNFNANNLVGQNIDVFHKNPAHQRSMLTKLEQTYRTQITVGGRTFTLIATPIFSETKERLGTIVEWADKTAEIKHNQELEAQQKELARVATETRRIKDALDACSTNVMMADDQFNIVYMNPAVQNMMRIAEADLKKELPNFNANDLIGKNIDVFHKNPAHQRSMLARLTDTYRTTIQVGSRTFTLVATPIFDDQKNRLGTVVEWADKTAEVHIEQEVASLIQAANEGDLTRRLDTQGQTGFAQTLSSGLNELMNKVSGFVNDVGIIFEAMSEGNLTKTIDNAYQGELEQIKNNANNSVAKLTEVLSKIQSASDIVRTSSNEVAQGSDDLSRRTESQASSLEETAASMEEITATVKQTAESATQSNTLASEAKLKAEKGGDVVQGAVKAMSEIMDASNKINDIIGVIDEIAFQTNLLALNAAVEAARAGEQGRGFAVVAGEVRTLSQRSAAAAKEIKDLIRDSVNKVESGSNLVNQSGQMLAEIVQAVDKVAKMISDVNTAAIEQNSGISQINQAVAQMDEMTQQNAALVEETSAASRSMSEEANSMSRLISFFQLAHHGGYSGTSANTRAEPIKTYKPSTGPAGKSNPTKSPKNKGSGSAASFSRDDDWEDF